MKVTTTKSISFPTLGWGLNAGEERDLPEDPEAAVRIMQEPEIVEVKQKVEAAKEIKNQD